MPLQLRGPDGQVIPIPGKPGELEYTDDLGRLALVVIQRSGGSIRIITPGSAEFATYCRVTKQKPSRVHVHEDFGG
jgi:hypothetical protein